MVGGIREKNSHDKEGYYVSWVCGTGLRGGNDESKSVLSSEKGGGDRFARRTEGGSSRCLLSPKSLRNTGTGWYVASKGASIFTGGVIQGGLGLQPVKGRSGRFYLRRQVLTGTSAHTEQNTKAEGNAWRGCTPGGIEIRNDL